MASPQYPGNKDIFNVFLAAVPLMSFTYATVLNPTIASTPPMGFNNWARFMCNLNETLFTTTADAMVSKGLLAAGYNRLNLDDCWMQYSRAPNGSLQWNTTLFPHGIPWLAQYVQKRGFRLGIYENAGNMTCGGYPGSEGYEKLDAETFESWGIDYLKLDGCHVYADPGHTLQEKYKELYGRWHRELSRLSRPLVFSESAPAYFSGGTDFPVQQNKSEWYRVMDWVPLYGELARHSNDIAVYGYYEASHYWPSVMNNYGYNLLLARYQQPGFYNDPDFIIPDWPELTLDEKKSQFALWASFSAPLIISAYVPDLSSDELAYLTNKDIIAVDQDPLGLQATLVSQNGGDDVLTKSLSNGDRLVTVLNRLNIPRSTLIPVERFGLNNGGPYVAKDLWTGTSKKLVDSMFVSLAPHATAIYRISNVTDVIPTGMIFNTATLGCLTADDTTVTFTNSTALDEHVWRVSNGRMSSLSDESLCVSGRGGKLTLRACNKWDNSQQWEYYVSGNVVNVATGQCLTQGHHEAGVAKCGDELDSQVFGLPSGVKVIR